MNIKDIVKDSIIYGIVDYNDENEYKTILTEYIENGLISNYILCTKVDNGTGLIKLNHIILKTNDGIIHKIGIDKRNFKLKKISDNI